MIKLVLEEVMKAIRAETIGAVQPCSIAAVSTDSRSIQPGSLFFALPGERFDGHDFVEAALRDGAVAAVIQKPRLEALSRQLAPLLHQGRRLLAVPDTVAALGRLAQFHRRQVPAEVIAVAGSNGKTTVKSMIHHVLSATHRGRCSPKSFNNAIGVPLTLLSVEGADEYVVVEIGTNRAGEVSLLAQLAEPQVAVLTSIGEEHLEGLHDLGGVAREECSIAAHVRSGGFLAANADAPLIREQLRGTALPCAYFGKSDDADLRIGSLRSTDAGLQFRINDRFDYRLPMLGAHNAWNAAAAIAVALRLGMQHEQIAERLATFEGPPMRHELLRVGEVTILNDAYNANPASAIAAIETLLSYPARGRRIVVFGEMRELGEQSPRQHARIAERLRHAQFDRVILVGPAADLMARSLLEPGLFATQVCCVHDVRECAAALQSDLRPGDVLLLKASRAVGLERVIDPLRKSLETAASAA